jgi:Uma2 family endonuclease
MASPTANSPETTTVAMSSAGVSSADVPPLSSGDHLSREEFERRYEAMPRSVKAELIAGVVYVQAPISAGHSEPHGDLMGWLALYRFATPGVLVGDNGTILIGADSEPQPDAYLRIAAVKQGQARIGARGYVEGAPELVAEIAATSANYDLHEKMDLYRRHGVREYLVWRVFDQDFDWFILRDGQFERLTLAADKVYRSEVFPGLWLDKAALLAKDLAAVQRQLQAGLATPEHAAFVQRLAQAPAAP